MIVPAVTNTSSIVPYGEEIIISKLFRYRYTIPQANRITTVTKVSHVLITRNGVYYRSANGVTYVDWVKVRIRSHSLIPGWRGEKLSIEKKQRATNPYNTEKGELLLKNFKLICTALKEQREEFWRKEYPYSERDRKRAIKNYQKSISNE